MSALGVGAEPRVKPCSLTWWCLSGHLASFACTAGNVLQQPRVASHGGIIVGFFHTTYTERARWGNTSTMRAVSGLMWTLLGEDSVDLLGELTTWPSTHNGRDDFSALVDVQGRDGHDAVFHRGGWVGISVEFRDGDATRVFFSQLFKDGCHLAAWPAPFRPKSTSTGMSDWRTAVSKVASVTATVCDMVCSLVVEGFKVVLGVKCGGAS